MGFLRGQPDWSHAQARTFTGAGESDLEASARRWWPLASLVTGEVHFFDDFEANVIHWNTAKTGAASSTILDTTKANSGAQSVRLRADGTANASASITRYLDMPHDNLIGVTCWVNPPTSRGTFQFVVSVFQNLRRQDYFTTLDLAASTLTVYSGGVQVMLVNPINLNAASGIFRMFQLLIDTDAKTYRGVRMGSAEFLTSLPSGTDVASTQVDTISVGIVYNNASGVSADFWVDDCIITRKQP